MANQRREPSKPETEQAKKTSDSSMELSPEELRAISGGASGSRPPVVLHPKPKLPSPKPFGG